MYQRNIYELKPREDVKILDDSYASQLYEEYEQHLVINLCQIFTPKGIIGIVCSTSYLTIRIQTLYRNMARHTPFK